MILLLSIISIEDFKSRSIRVIWLLLLICSVIVSKELQGISWFNEFLINLLLISITIGLSMLFLMLIGVNVKSIIGIGDFLLILAYTLYFPTYEFFGMLLLSFVVASMLYFILSSFKKKQNTLIPLAGYMSCIWIVYLSLFRFDFLPELRVNLFIPYL